MDAFNNQSSQFHNVVKTAYPVATLFWCVHSGVVTLFSAAVVTKVADAELRNAVLERSINYSFH